jgi:hypothetical protein
MFSKFDIGEIWLPWTWDERSEVARKMQRIQANLTEQLVEHVKALGIDAKQNTWSILKNLSLTGNKHAIDSLKSGFGDSKVKVRYLKAGNILEPDDIKVPGLVVHVLSPPDSGEFLAQMDPPNYQRYLRMGMVRPNRQILFSSLQKDGVNSDSINVGLDKEEEERLQKLAKCPVDDPAFALDQARNNESLVTLFIFGNRYLLLAGDAQYGNWRWWLEKDDSIPLITQRTTLYVIKVENTFK